MRLLLVDPPGLEGPIPLEPEDLRRLRKVLRLEDGATLEVVDPGHARQGTAVLRGRQLEVASWAPLGPDPHPDLVVVTAALKGERLEWAAQRAFEAGLRGLRLVRTARAQLDPPPRLLRRLEAVARAACEQSGRRHLPALGAHGDLAAALDQAAHEGRELLLLHPGGEPFPPRLAGPAALVIGPEGGLTEAEVEQAAGRGARVLGLGGHVLRAETALVVGVTLALDRLGWLGAAPAPA